MIARQPICDSQLTVVAYEILYRGDSQHQAVIDNADGATIDVLLSMFTDHSIQDVVSDKLAFINFTSNIILNNMLPLDSDQLVVELLEDQPITKPLINKIKRLRSDGTRIALDDFTLNGQTLPLVEHADFIKIDVLTEPLAPWEDYIPRLKAKGITFLAEKVETLDIFEQCKAMGFTLFQGYFFAKPHLVEGKKLTRSQYSVVNLLNKISSPDIEMTELVNIITQDPGMSYNLLRSVNSSLFNLPAKVHSVTQAVTLLGIAKLRNWLNFIALSTLDDKPQILSDTAITRGKMCEWLGMKITNSSATAKYFTVGLLSVIDAFFDQPMVNLIDKLSLDDDMKHALVKQEGTLGKVLRCIVDHEQGKWQAQHETFLNYYNIEPEEFFMHYLQVVKSLSLPESYC